MKAFIAMCYPNIQAHTLTTSPIPATSTTITDVFQKNIEESQENFSFNPSGYCSQYGQASQ